MSFYPQIPLQYMGAGEVIPPVENAVVGLVLTDTMVVEGATLRVTVARNGASAGVCSVRWSATAPVGDLTGVTTDVLSFAENVQAVSFTVATVQRAGVQGMRGLTLRLTEPQGCVVDSSTSEAVVIITDAVEIPDIWYKQPIVSGREWASGVGEDADPVSISGFIDFLGKPIDVGAGSTTPASNMATWDQVMGGPESLAGIDGLVTPSQLDWLKRVSTFSVHLDAPVGSRWLFFGISLIPTERRTDGGDSSVWDEIAAGSHDSKYQKIGERIAGMLDRKGQPVERFVCIIHLEANRVRHFQVFADTRVKFRSAAERAIDQMRLGAGKHLRFALVPAQEPNIGDLTTWFPGNADAIGLTYLPDLRITDAAKVTALLNGTLEPSMYGLTTDLLNASNNLNVPLIFPYWRARYEWGTSTSQQFACPTAYDATKSFMDFLASIKDRLVGDSFRGVWPSRKGIYQGPQAGGGTNWDLSVDYVRFRYGTGPDPALPGAVVGLDAVPVQVVEGGVAAPNVIRSGDVDKSCRVRWTATAPAGSISGVTSAEVNFGTGVLSLPFSVQTVNQTGTQGTRQLQIALSGPVDCSIDPAKALGVTAIVDSTAGGVRYPENPNTKFSSYGGTEYFIGPNTTAGPSTVEASPGGYLQTLQGVNDGSRGTVLPGSYPSFTAKPKAGQKGAIRLLPKFPVFTDLDLTSFDGGMVGYNRADAAKHSVFTGQIDLVGFSDLWLQGHRLGVADERMTGDTGTTSAKIRCYGDATLGRFNWLVKNYFKNNLSQAMLLGSGQNDSIAWNNYFTCNRRMWNPPEGGRPERWDWANDYFIFVYNDGHDHWAVENFYRGGSNQGVSFKKTWNKGIVLGNVVDAKYFIKGTPSTGQISDSGGSGGTFFIVGQEPDRVGAVATGNYTEVAYNKSLRIGGVAIHISNTVDCDVHDNVHDSPGTGKVSVYRIYTGSNSGGTVLAPHPRNWKFYRDTFVKPANCEVEFGRTRVKETVQRTDVDIRDMISSATLESVFHSTYDQSFLSNSSTRPDLDNNARMRVTFGPDAKIAVPSHGGGLQVIIE